MKNMNQIEQLVIEAEFILEGLDKGFWRLIKLCELQRWNAPKDDNGSEHVVVATFGHYCIAYNENDAQFQIGRYEAPGIIMHYLDYQGSLHHLVSEIVASRFVLYNKIS